MSPTAGAASVRASGQRAATPPAGTSAPAPGEQPGLERHQAEHGGADRPLQARSGDGSRAASAWAPPTAAAYAPTSPAGGDPAQRRAAGAGGEPAGDGGDAARWRRARRAAARGLAPCDLAARDRRGDADVRADDRGGGERGAGAVRAAAHQHVERAAGRHARRRRPASPSARGRRPRRCAASGASTVERARRRRRRPRAPAAAAVSPAARPSAKPGRHAARGDRAARPLDGVDRRGRRSR